MKKNIYVSLFGLVLLTSFLGYYYKLGWFNSSGDNPGVVLENSVSQEEAQLSIVTFGERITNDDIHFHQWETLSGKDTEAILFEEQVFLFSVDEFKKDTNAKLIQQLIDSNKTVMFYGYRIDAEKIISATSFPIPFYPMHSSKEIYHYLYGVEYSSQHEQLIPITVMGNFSETEMASKISQFLLKHYATK